MGSHFHIFPLLLLFFLPTGTSDLAADRAALLHLSSAVGGHTLRWNLSSPTPCSWEGVTCDKATNRVTELRLPGDNLSGQIPLNSVGNLTHLRALSLRHNSLSGLLPSDLDSATQLRQLSLQENQFSGQIPATLFRLSNLTVLNLARNNFSGEISPAINNLTNLKKLYLENNNLNGSIPDLNNLTSLQKINVSYNKLNGSIPSRLINFSSNSFLGNSLCGSPLGACPSDRNNGNKLSAGVIAGIVIGSVMVLLLIIIVLIIRRRNGTSEKTSRQAEISSLPSMPQDFDCRSPKPLLMRENGNAVKNDELVFLGDENVVFSLEELLTASADVLGNGTFGSSYRACLRVENEVVVVVVKRLRNVCIDEIEFREKVEHLGMLGHENLVPLKAYYYGRGEKMLVYECLPMGGLSTLLHGKRAEDREPLTWQIRSKIALGAARGIEYLHSLGSNISHGNIKSSNIILTNNYGACVSEYGIVQLVSSTSTVSMNGYCAPEAMDSHKISQKADVYSFGVVLLELLTRMTPTDDHWKEEGTDLPRWVKSAVREKRTIDVFDHELFKYQNKEEELVRLLHLGIHCTSQHPGRRPSMEDVTKRIEEICGLR
ncbi:hypothetical protein CsSME_00022641 [Camellia sinensis var. sinensis]